MNNAGRPLWRSTLMVILALFLLAGCGASDDAAGGEDIPPDNAAAPSNAVTPSNAAVPSTNEQIFLYRGEDRNELFLENALKEGIVNWYTTDNQKDAEATAAMFNKKYPGIMVNIYRAKSDDILNKITAEAQAGVHAVDTFTGDFDLLPLQDLGLTSSYYSPSVAKLADNLIFPNAEETQWATTQVTLYAITYNTNLVNEAEIPEAMDWDDLGAPAWRGRIGIDQRDWYVYGVLANAFGEDKAKAIIQGWADNDPLLRDGHALLAQLQSAGEFAITPTQYSYIADRESRNGAPLKWVLPSSGAIANPRVAFVAKNAPHPYAVMLLLDYQLSEENQRVIAEAQIVPSIPALSEVVPSVAYEDFLVIDPIKLMENTNDYQRAWDEIMLGR